MPPTLLFFKWSYGCIRIASSIDHCMQVQHRLSGYFIYIYLIIIIYIYIYVGHAWVDLSRFGDDVGAIWGPQSRLFVKHGHATALFRETWTHNGAFS
jgi:hypothetical protein